MTTMMLQLSVLVVILVTTILSSSGVSADSSSSALSFLRSRQIQQNTLTTSVPTILEGADFTQAPLDEVGQNATTIVPTILEDGSFTQDPDAQDATDAPLPNVIYMNSTNPNTNASTIPTDSDTNTSTTTTPQQPNDGDSTSSDSTPVPPPAAAPATSSLSTGAIVGIAFGAGIGVGLLVAALVFTLRKKCFRDEVIADMPEFAKPHPSHKTSLAAAGDNKMKKSSSGRFGRSSTEEESTSEYDMSTTVSSSRGVQVAVGHPMYTPYALRVLEEADDEEQRIDL